MPHVLMQQKHEFTSTCTTAESKNAMVSGAENPQTWSFWKCSSDTPWKTHCFLRLAWCSNVFQCWVVTHHIKIKSLNCSECVYCFDADAEKTRFKRKQWFQTSNEFMIFLLEWTDWIRTNSSANFGTKKRQLDLPQFHRKNSHVPTFTQLGPKKIKSPITMHESISM